MSKLDELVNAGENLSTDARLELAERALRQAADVLAQKKVPLTADHRLYIENQHKEEKKSLITGLVLLAGSLSVLGILACRGKKFVEGKMKEEEDRLEQEKKEMIRRLSAIKGRQ